MNQLKELLTWLTAPAGAAVLAALWRFYVKIRDDAIKRKTEAHVDHKAHDDKLKAMQETMEAFAANLSAAQASEAAMRAERDALRAETEAAQKKIQRLETERGRLIAAIPARASGE